MEQQNTLKFICYTTYNTYAYVHTFQIHTKNVTKLTNDAHYVQDAIN